MAPWTGPLGACHSRWGGTEGEMAAVAEEEEAREASQAARVAGVSEPQMASGPRQVTEMCGAHGVRQQGMMGTVANLESACPT